MNRCITVITGILVWGTVLSVNPRTEEMSNHGVIAAGIGLVVLIVTAAILDHRDDQ